MDQGSDGPLIDPAGPDVPIRAVVDVLDRDGKARVTLPVQRWPVTVGRAVTCDIVLDDPVRRRSARDPDRAGRRRAAAGGRRDRQRRLAEEAAHRGGRADRARRRRRRAGRRHPAARAPRRRTPCRPSGRGCRRRPAASARCCCWACCSRPGNAVELWLHDDPGGRADRLSAGADRRAGRRGASGPRSGRWGRSWCATDSTSGATCASRSWRCSAMGVAALVLPVFAFTSGWAWPSRIVSDRRQRHRLVGDRGAHRPHPAGPSARAGGGDGVAVRGRPGPVRDPPLRDAGSRLPRALRRHAGAAGAPPRADGPDGPLHRRSARRSRPCSRRTSTTTIGPAAPTTDGRPACGRR